MRLWLLASLAVALVLLGLLLGLMMPRHCPVNRAAFERIKEGMTQAEVHAILGGPPGDYRTRPPPSMVLEPYCGLVGHREVWEGDEGIVEVVFSGGSHTPVGPVIFRYFWDEETCQAKPLQLALWRLEKFRASLFP